MSESPRKIYKTRSRAKTFPSTPVFSTFHDQAVRERAALGITAPPTEPASGKATAAPKRRAAPKKRSVPKKRAATSPRKRSAGTQASAPLKDQADTASQSAGTGSSATKASSATPAAATTSSLGAKAPLGGGPSSKSGDPKSDVKVSAAATAPPQDPCTKYTTGLAAFKDKLATRGPGNVESPVVDGVGVDNETVSRALASVTEAISELDNGVNFSLLDPLTFDAITGGWTPNPCARPGNEVLVPWTAGSGGAAHTSLYVVRRTTDDVFALSHYDSANNNWHRGTRMSDGNAVRQALHAATWSRGANTTVTTAVARSDNSTRQRAAWECGIHVVLYGWAYALKLQLVTSPLPTGDRYTTFLQEAGVIINLALQGLMDSATIKNFMECYGFIKPGQRTREDGRFRYTVRLERVNDHTSLIRGIIANEIPAAKLRIDAALDAIRASDPNRQVPDVAAIILQFSTEGSPLPDLTTTTAEDLLSQSENLALFTGTVATLKAPTTI